MLSINQTDLSDKENYNILIGSVIPRPIAFVTTLSETGELNLAPFSFFNIVSYRPAILSISIQRNNGQMKDTARHILRQGEAVIHTVSRDNLSQVNQAAIELPADQSELPYTHMTPAPSTRLKTPGVLEAKLRFETTLYQHIPISDDRGELVADLILLQIVHSHLDEEIYQENHILAERLEPMSRLAGQDYAQLGAITSLKRP